jgi:hypothetical protein
MTRLPILFASLLPSCSLTIVVPQPGVTQPCERVAAVAASECVSDFPAPSYGQGLVNWARTGVASQSTTAHFNWDAVASLAIDGNTDGDYFHHSLSHTESTPHAWWQVDLGKNYPLAKIVLWNRTDCCAERLTNFRVTVMDDKNAIAFDHTYCGDGSHFGPAMTINLPGSVKGRAVRVMLNGANYLQLAEVEVFGPAV